MVIRKQLSDLNPSSAVDDGVGDYNYDNSNDQDNFCPHVVCERFYFLFSEREFSKQKFNVTF